MSRRGRRDAVVVGGGVVGATCALALAGAGLKVALVEARQPPPWDPRHADLRVYALAPGSAALFEAIDAWAPVRDAVTLAGDGDVPSAAVQPYVAMRVWDAGGDGELAFHADAFARRELGWIAQHALLVDRLWQSLPGAGVEVRIATVTSLEQEDDGVILRLDDGARLEARLAVAADGADSTLRALAGLPVASHDYHQQGVVAYVETALPHQATAWQRFLPGGPLALLPCGDGRSSIVWTLPDAQAQRVMALDAAAFDRELTIASAARLGAVHVASPRAAFPLRRQLASAYVADRVVVLGDAAHVVHPLAGQGVNLGLRDVAALRTLVVDAAARGVDWASAARLARWARSRRSENAAAAYLFEGLNRLYSNDAVVATLLRGGLLQVAGRARPLAATLWRRAAGL